MPAVLAAGSPAIASSVDYGMRRRTCWPARPANQSGLQSAVKTASDPAYPRPGFIAPLLTSLAQHDPQTFTDITQGTNALFGGACCPARPGFDLATGWGSPVADVIASALPR